jgi:hypothetical protein
MDSSLVKSAIREWLRVRERRSELKDGSKSTNFIWSLGYALECDVSPFRGVLPRDYSTGDRSWTLDPRRYARKPRSGDLVWVASRFLPVFFKECLPRIKVPFALVASDGDESFPGSSEDAAVMGAAIDDPRILAVFAQNADGSLKHPKLDPLPIGLDFHTVNRSGGFWGEERRTAQEQEERLNAIIAGSPPLGRRIPKAFVDFHLSDRVIYDGTRRSDVLRDIMASGCVDLATGQLPRSELWALKGGYAFSVSPHGNGLDCHRTWEDLALGCIVIVKASSLDPLYDGLPVAIVDKWSEVTAQAMAGWIDRFADIVDDARSRRRLTLSYWIDRIRSKAKAAARAGS